jgi:DNA-binding MarR family transcriptional regulator
MNKRAAITAISKALADLQVAYDDRDRALAEFLGVGLTDLRCLDLIMRGGPQTSSELGATLHLTRGSMTTLIDRLERAGYAQRRPDPHHGKRKLISPTPRLVDAITPLGQLRQAEGIRELEAEPLADLRIVLAFLESTLARQSRTCIAYQASSAG